MTKEEVQFHLNEILKRVGEMMSEIPFEYRQNRFVRAQLDAIYEATHEASSLVSHTDIKFRV